MEVSEKQYKNSLMAKTSILKKFTQWEYWPGYMFYIPNLPYAVYLGIKARNFSFYSAVNPTIKSSGNGTESKFETLKLVPESYRPISLFVPKERDFDTVIRAMHKKGIDFPIIAKPDVGFRGMLVEKINSDAALKKYLEDYKLPTILQEFIDLPNECGVFYYRMPGEKSGVINSLTFKSFLSVDGNGFSTLEELVNFDKRAQHYIPQLEKIHKERWNKIPLKGEKVLLSVIGNHARGTQFLNANHFIDDTLLQTFNKLNSEIAGWYYGRLDVKYNTWEELKNGENFKILEINGIISEPTHIYDPYSTTYFNALKTFRKHWDIVERIAKLNLQKGVPSKNFKEFWREIMWLNTYTKKVKKLAKSLG